MFMKQISPRVRGGGGVFSSRQRGMDYFFHLKSFLLLTLTWSYNIMPQRCCFYYFFFLLFTIMPSLRKVLSSFRARDRLAVPFAPFNYIHPHFIDPFSFLTHLRSVPMLSYNLYTTRHKKVCQLSTTFQTRVLSPVSTHSRRTILLSVIKGLIVRSPDRVLCARVGVARNGSSD